MNYKFLVSAVFAVAMVFVITSCRHDPYETGDGELSYLHTDYADVTVTDGKITDITTDNNVSLNIKQGITIQSLASRDTTLRWLLYYNKVSETQPVELVSYRNIYVMNAIPASSLDEKKNDPVKLTSVWVSPNRKYLNMHLGIMTGNAADNDSRQQLQIVCDSVSNIGRGTIFYSLYHNQNNIPEYYTQDVYLCTPYPAQDTISITLNTYSGSTTRRYYK